ncbi:hypothetical protein [Roseivivax sediminis]|uniref:Uncharacterized protein n=1 Tax=Roseivivax sediminis TaxID=936889 RepID=A0A1I1WU32_9RHOB|nr:hypothetical protein [Roseivivax sediminis]SFD98715.1 hypothetical protein SAMN04515678_105104 [Roseivivax sediminis]
MNEIDELQSRITAALDRIRMGVDRLGLPAEATGAGPEEVAALQQALEEERLANAQLEERVHGIRDKQERQVSELREQVAASREALAQLDGELGRLRQANEVLSATIEELTTTAMAEGGGDPHLVNQAMRAELEALRAARATDKAESAALVATLQPLLADAAEKEEEA